MPHATGNALGRQVLAIYGVPMPRQGRVAKSILIDRGALRGNVKMGRYCVIVCKYDTVHGIQ
jgi:hypothetical protein